MSIVVNRMDRTRRWEQTFLFDQRHSVEREFLFVDAEQDNITLHGCSHAISFLYPMIVFLSCLLICH